VRVHRIGQKRNVEVTRFIVENSIESRIMELHEQAKHLCIGHFGEVEQGDQSGEVPLLDVQILISVGTGKITSNFRYLIEIFLIANKAH